MRGHRFSCSSLMFGCTLVALMLTGCLELRILAQSLELPFEQRGHYKECISLLFVTYYFSIGVGAFVGGALGLLGIGDISKSLSTKILLFGVSSIVSLVLYLATAS